MTAEPVQQSFADLDEDLATRAAITERARRRPCSSRPARDRARPRPSSTVWSRSSCTATCRCARSRRSRSPRRPPPSCATGSGAPSNRSHAATIRWPPSGRARALEELDGAAVSTLHAFAQRILTEHPVEAGLPPRIEVLDDIASQLAFEERWAAVRRRTARRPGARAHRAPRARTPTPRSRCCARSRSPATPTGTSSPNAWDPSPTRRRSTGALGPVLAALGELARLAAHCPATDDKLARRSSSASAPGIASWPPRPTSSNSSASSPSAHRRGAPIRVEGPTGRRSARSIGPRASSRPRARWSVATAAQLTEAVVRRLAWELAQFTLREAGGAGAPGALEFHDLLVLARVDAA